MQRSVIYFVQAGNDEGPIKIGVTYDVPSRILAVQTGNHEELKLIGAIYSTRDLETRIHRDYDAFRIRGEWFRPNQRLLAFIDSLPKDLFEELSPKICHPTCVRCKRQLKIVKNGYCSVCNNTISKYK